MKVVTVQLPQLQYREGHGVTSGPVKVAIPIDLVAVSAWISGQYDRAIRITAEDGEVLLEINEAGFTHGPVELAKPRGGTLTVERYNADTNKWSPADLSDQLVIHCRDWSPRWSQTRGLTVTEEPLERPLDPPLGWRIVEVFGHARYDGYVEHVRIAGTNMLKIRCPMPDGGEVVRIFSPKAVFSIHETTEAEIRAGTADVPLSPSRWPRRQEHDAEDEDPEGSGPDDEPYDSSIPF